MEGFAPTSQELEAEPGLVPSLAQLSPPPAPRAASAPGVRERALPDRVRAPGHMGLSRPSRGSLRIGHTPCSWS